jgi:hypothetical protein
MRVPHPRGPARSRIGWNLPDIMRRLAAPPVTAPHGHNGSESKIKTNRRGAEESRRRRGNTTSCELLSPRRAAAGEGPPPPPETATKVPLCGSAKCLRVSAVPGSTAYSSVIGCATAHAIRSGAFAAPLFDGLGQQTGVASQHGPGLNADRSHRPHPDPQKKNSRKQVRRGGDGTHGISIIAEQA